MSETNALVGAPGELHFTVHITRKATGKTETHHLIGTPIPIPEESKEATLGGDTFDRSP